MTIATQQRIKTSRTAQLQKPNSSLEFKDLDILQPGSREVRIQVQACGICHSDSFAFNGGFPGTKYPIVPGHEIAGVVEEVGSEVSRLKKGDRVGVGWHAGHCHECSPCRSGDFINCVQLKTPGINVNGGYAEYATFPEEVCALLPQELEMSEAVPLMCAGVTTYNALRHAGAKPGDTVAILGVGGLGHLGVQFANKMGFCTVAIARGSDKADFARKLGAHHYIDSESSDAVNSLAKLGGAKVVLSTITSSAAMSPWVAALAIDGRMVLLGADTKPMEISPLTLIPGRRSVSGWPSGTAKDSEDCLRFAALTSIRPMIEKYPFAKAQEAYERMMSGKARFRVVLEIK